MPRKENYTIDMGNEPFPTRLRKAMEDKGISQKVLAGYLGLKRQTISQYCLGHSSPDFKTFCKIADYFGVSADYLLGRTEAKTTEPELRSVCDYTGLSDKAVIALKAITKYKTYGNTLSKFISDNFFYQLICNVGQIIWQPPAELPDVPDILALLQHRAEVMAQVLISKVIMESGKTPDDLNFEKLKHLNTFNRMDELNKFTFQSLKKTLPPEQNECEDSSHGNDSKTR